MMRRIATSLALLTAAGGGLACSAAPETSDDAYGSTASEVELISAALDEDMDGDEADEAVSDQTMDGMREAARSGRHHRGRGGHLGGRDGRRHLLRWFGDPEALQACRDMRDACEPDDEACHDAVKACVHDVLTDAFASMCEDATNMCAEDDAPARPCERIEAACSGDLQLPDFSHHRGDGGMHGDWRGHDDDDDRDWSRPERHHGHDAGI